MKFIDRSTDPWLLLPDSEIAGPAPHRLLPLAQWEAVRDNWPAGVPVGVLLPNTVVVDMMPLLQRCGVDAVVLREGQRQASAECALGFFPQGHYQGDVLQPQPH